MMHKNTPGIWTLAWMKNLADTLNELQAKENDGRGVSCVRGIMVELRCHRKFSAQAIANNEYDKIRNYPAIKAVVDENFGTEDK